MSTKQKKAIVYWLTFIVASLTVILNTLTNS